MITVSRHTCDCGSLLERITLGPFQGNFAAGAGKLSFGVLLTGAALWFTYATPFVSMFLIREIFVTDP